MDGSKLIAIVQEYEEKYNLKNSNYSNQQRRDNIWNEIGKRLNQNGNVCKERWTRIRDNHRKALNLREVRSGQAASKLKPPKFSQELSFLVPYLNDEEERRSSLSPGSVYNNDETQLEALSDSSNLDTTSDAGSQQSIQSDGTIGRKSTYTASQTSQGPTAANVPQQYLTRTDQNRNLNDPLLNFFMNMAKTVKTFPLQDQIRIKSQLFQMVNSVVMRLAITQINPEYCNSNFMASGSNESERVRILSNVNVTPSVNKTLYNMMSPPPPSAMKETLHNPSPANPEMFPRSSTPNEMPPSPIDVTMSSRTNSGTLRMMPSQENVNYTESLHALDHNRQILSQYLHFNKN